MIFSIPSERFDVVFGNVVRVITRWEDIILHFARAFSWMRGNQDKLLLFDLFYKHRHHALDNSIQSFLLLMLSLGSVDRFFI